MSDTDKALQTSEDKFLGVKNTVDSPDTDESEVQVEVIDDRPAADRRPARAAEGGDEDDLSESELAQLSVRAQKRIKKLKFEFHEERRAKEQKDREAQEAIRFAQVQQRRSAQLEKMLAEGGKVLTEQATQNAKAQADAARAKLAKAHEAGDAGLIADATAELSSATINSYTAPNIAQRFAAQMPEEESGQTMQSPKQPDPKAVTWQQKNSWFGKDPEKTSFAYGVHEKLVRSGVDPNSDDYYSRLNKRMREVFPELAEGNEADEVTTVVETQQSRTATPRRPSVVAPVTRGNGSAPRKVLLTATQVSLAKRLGLTSEQYAKQLLKENGNG